MLQLKNVGLDRAGGKKAEHILRRINCTLPSRGLVLICGEPGSGKTALMHVLSGRELPSRGEMYIDGENYTRWPEAGKAAWRRRTGSADPELLLPDRSLEENALLSARLSGGDVRECRSLAVGALETMGLTDRAACLPEELSAQERKLAAVACALARDPDLLLVEEPLEELCHEAGEALLGLLRERAENHLVAVSSRDKELLGGEQDLLITLAAGEISDTQGEPDAETPFSRQERTGQAPGGRLSQAMKNLTARRSRITSRLLGVFAPVLLTCLGLALLLGGEARNSTLQSQTLAAYPIVMTRESVASGDLEALADYLEASMDIRSASLQKTYAITPRIFSYTAGDVRQVSPETQTGTNLWTELPDGEALQRSRYQLVSGRWPARYDEAAVLLDSQGSLDPACMAALGLTSQEMARGMSYTDLLRLSFRVVLPTGEYVQNVDGTWGYMAGDSEFMSAMVRSSQPLNIVGILRPVSKGAGDTDVGGAVYTGDLTRWVVNAVKTSQIVKEQMAEPENDVLTHRPFDAAAHETSPDGRRSALQKLALGLAPADQAALYQELTGLSVEEPLAQDSLLQRIAAMSDEELGRWYTEKIESAVSPFSLEGNLRSFGVLDAETLTGLRLYANTFAYRGTAVKLLNNYAERVRYTDSAAGVVAAGAALLENTQIAGTWLRWLILSMGTVGVILASCLPLLSRRRELAVERLLGLPGAAPAGTLAWEALLLSLLGSAAGVLIPMALQQLGGGSLLGAALALPWTLAAAVSLGAVALSVASARLSAGSVAAGTPEEALRRAMD